MDYSGSYDKGRTFVTASITLAVLSLFTIQFVIFPFIFGGLSIIFALLSRGQLQKINGIGKTAVVLSSISMGITFFIAVMALQILLLNPAQREELNRYSIQIYGQTFDEMLKSAFPGSVEHTEGN